MLLVRIRAVSTFFRVPQELAYWFFVGVYPKSGPPNELPERTTINPNPMGRVGITKNSIETDENRYGGGSKNLKKKMSFMDSLLCGYIILNNFDHIEECVKT